MRLLVSVLDKVAAADPEFTEPRSYVRADLLSYEKCQAIRLVVEDYDVAQFSLHLDAKLAETEFPGKVTTNFEQTGISDEEKDTGNY